MNNDLRLDLLSKEEVLPIVQEIINKKQNLQLNPLSSKDLNILLPDLGQELTNQHSSVICEIYDGSYSNEDLYDVIRTRLPILKDYFSVKNCLIVILGNIDQFVFDKVRSLLREYEINVSIYDLQRIQNWITEFPHLVEKVRLILSNNDYESNSRANLGTWFLADQMLSNGEDKSKNFLNGGFWEPEDKTIYNKYLRDTKANDLIVLKSSYEKDTRISALGKVLYNHRSIGKLEVDWKIKDLNVFIESTDYHRAKYVLLNDSDVNQIVNKIGKDVFKGFDVVGISESNDLPSEVPYHKSKSHIANVNSDSYSGEDHLDITNDVEAFARLIASKNLKPPLAIALFGEWGSGKSFFMEKLISKIQNFTNQQHEKTMYCNGIVQIKFNAWAYMDANLYASLVSNIFEKLTEYLSDETKAENEVETAKSDVTNTLSSLNEERKKKLTEKEELKLEVELLENERLRLIKEKDEKVQSVFNNKIKIAYEEIDKKLRLEETIISELKRFGIDSNKLKDFSAINPIDEFKLWIYFFKHLVHFKTWQLIFLIVALSLTMIVCFINIPFVNVQITNIWGRIVAFVLAAVPFWLNIIASLKPLISLYKKIRPYVKSFNSAVNNATEERNKKIKLVGENLEHKNKEINEKAIEIVEVDKDIEKAESQLKYSITQKAFYGFITTKSLDEKYDKVLSIISTIRKDFETLSELFQSYNIPPNLTDDEKSKAEQKKAQIEKFKNKFEKPLDRIVLYIDDLDRCSEDKVVEVLEAVNLLMAYPLFVVVVGVDKRWVKNALYKRHSLQFSNNRNSDNLEYKRILPEDYLEKIFQIPFQLKPASDTKVKEMIRNQLNPYVIIKSDGDFDEDDFDGIDYLVDSEGNGLIDSEGNRLVFDSRPKDVTLEMVDKLDEIEYLSISEEHIKLLECFSGIIGANPRAIKRIINLYQLISAHEDFRRLAFGKEECHMIVMLQLSILNGKFKSTHIKVNKMLFDHTLIVFLQKHDSKFQELSDLFKKHEQFKKFLDLDMSQYHNLRDFVQRFTFLSND